jgi:hypothetical protein
MRLVKRPDRRRRTSDGDTNSISDHEQKAREIEAAGLLVETAVSS